MSEPRGVDSGGAGGSGGAKAFPNFGRSVNPISTGEADYAYQIILAPTPGFSDLPTALEP